MKFLKKKKVCQDCAYLEGLHERWIRYRPDLRETISKILKGAPYTYVCRRWGIQIGFENLTETFSYVLRKKTS